MHHPESKELGKEIPLNNKRVKEKYRKARLFERESQTEWRSININVYETVQIKKVKCF